MFKPAPQQKKRKRIDVTQKDFNKGYVSELADSRIPKDALADMINAWLTQDGLPTPRPSLVRYGVQPLGPVLGIGTFIKIVDGAPERWEISIQNISDEGHICVRKDGEIWVDKGGVYDVGFDAMFAQSNNRVYIANGHDPMSYYNIYTDAVVVYTALATPGTPVAVATALTGTNYTFYYRYTASNSAGETNASVADTIQTDKLRDEWSGTDKVTLTLPAVTGATSYNIYVGTSAGNEKQVATGITSLTYVDNGTAAANPFKVAPAGNSTEGPTLTYIYNKNGQLFGVGDIDNPYYMWYSGTGEQSGDFSPFNGGGYVAIDYGGDTVPVAVRPFRDGKGTAVITVLSRGSAGGGKLSHVTYNTQTVGSTTFVYPEVYEANGQAGTVSPRGVVEADNAIHYPTGTNFSTTGTKANVVNILTTNSTSQAIELDVRGLTLNAMDKVVGLEYQNKIFWAVPFGTSENSEIWIKDLSRNGVWILRWLIPAKFMWLYEDNNGYTHHCVLVNDVILEFNEEVRTTDDGTPFSTRVSTGHMTFDEAGVSMAAIQHQRFKLLYPQGNIRINVYGLGENGDSQKITDQDFVYTVSNTGYGDWLYDSTDPVRFYDGDIGEVEFLSSAMEVVPIEVDEILNEIYDDIITDGPGCHYALSAINTTGIAIERYYYGDQ